MHADADERSRTETGVSLEHQLDVADGTGQRHRADDRRARAREVVG